MNRVQLEWLPWVDFLRVLGQKSVEQTTCRSCRQQFSFVIYKNFLFCKKRGILFAVDAKIDFHRKFNKNLDRRRLLRNKDRKAKKTGHLIFNPLQRIKILPLVRHFIAAPNYCAIPPTSLFSREATDYQSVALLS